VEALREKKRHMNFRLSEKTVIMIERLCDYYDVDMTAVVQISVQELYRKAAQEQKAHRDEYDN
jgi:hypothetical protein